MRVTLALTDTVPANRWELDITTEAGHRQFMEVAGDVKGMVAAIVKARSIHCRIVYAS